MKLSKFKMVVKIIVTTILLLIGVLLYKKITFYIASNLFEFLPSSLKNFDSERNITEHLLSFLFLFIITFCLYKNKKIDLY